MPVHFSADRLVHRVGHPSFTEGGVRAQLADLSVPELRLVWRLSGAVQAHPASPRSEINLVVLRGAVMDALEVVDPQFLGWLLSQPLGRGRVHRR